MTKWIQRWDSKCDVWRCPFLVDRSTASIRAVRWRASGTQFTDPALDRA